MHTVLMSECPAGKVAIPAFSPNYVQSKTYKKKDRLKMDKEIK